ncbi:MAG: hypothetical protein A2284_15380 [Deltaproteobacteria bacterium RIFOXYA12_FULL_61_11]|nr:MAG: hypothetical protein A2284_15380 [Deltaproteobacteria bacterium RIFOXYA12_FULL_61_11]
MGLDLTQIIEQVGKDKGIEMGILVEAIETALVTAAKKKYGNTRDIEAQFNPEVGEIELFEFKTVVDEVTNDHLEIEFKAAKQHDPEARIGDSLGFKLDTNLFGRVAAHTAKQIILQKVREAEREIIFSEYKDRQGELVSGIVRRFERRDIIIDLGKTEAVLPENEQIRRERYRVGDRVQAFLLRVERVAKGPQLILSRVSTQFLNKLFEQDVPEIHDRTVKIMATAREPGRRSKIAVYSEDLNVDPVGACVGVRGSRVQNIVQELRGEKIDIVPWSPDPAKFICNAIAPAEVQKVIIDNENQTMELIVADDQLSLAIGKRGQNVRLASQLTKWKVDIQSESRIKEKAQEMKLLLTRTETIDEATVNLVIKHGLINPDDLLEMEDGDLSEMLGIGLETAKTMKTKLVVVREQRTEELKVVAEQEAAERARGALEQGVAPTGGDIHGEEPLEDDGTV